MGPITISIEQAMAFCAILLTVGAWIATIRGTKARLRTLRRQVQIMRLFLVARYGLAAFTAAERALEPLETEPDDDSDGDGDGGKGG